MFDSGLLIAALHDWMYPGFIFWGFCWRNVKKKKFDHHAVFLRATPPWFLILSNTNHKTAKKSNNWARTFPLYILCMVSIFDLRSHDFKMSQPLIMRRFDPKIRRQKHLPLSGPFSHRALYILINDTIAWMVMLALHYIWRLCGKVCVCIWSRSCHFPLKSRQKPPLGRSGETLLSLVEVTFILKHKIQFLVLFERFSSCWWLRSNARHLELKEMSKKTHKIKAISFIMKGW